MGEPNNSQFSGALPKEQAYPQSSLNEQLLGEWVPDSVQSSARSVVFVGEETDSSESRFRISNVATTVTATDVFSPKTQQASCELRDLGAQLPSPQGVHRYLFAHPGMCDIVIRAAQLSRAEFGSEATLILDACTDPETSHRYLRLRIRVQAYSEAFAHKLFRLQTQCPATDRSGNTLLITSDFA
jgi:hypothetical protein